jgi:hypothetical protein
MSVVLRLLACLWMLVLQVDWVVQVRLRSPFVWRCNNLFMNITRIVLVVLDRNIDLTPMLSHSWTYQALVHDVLEMKLNRVTVMVCLSSFNGHDQ